MFLLPGVLSLNPLTRGLLQPGASLQQTVKFKTYLSSTVTKSTIEISLKFKISLGCKTVFMNWARALWSVHFFLDLFRCHIACLCFLFYEIQRVMFQVTVAVGYCSLQCAAGRRCAQVLFQISHTDLGIGSGQNFLGNLKQHTGVLYFKTAISDTCFICIFLNVNISFHFKTTFNLRPFFCLNGWS